MNKNKLFSRKDKKQLAMLGIPCEVALGQVENFRKGFPYLDITKPATVGQGIIRLESHELDKFIGDFDGYKGKLTKFVPASGAATRMFKHLFEFIDDYPKKKEACFNDKGFNSIHYFFEHITKFAFYKDLEKELQKSRVSVEQLVDEKKHDIVLKVLLQPYSMDYGNLPKGLIKFHSYPEGARTAFEEHLVEGAQYARMPNNDVYIHLTVSPEHKSGFIKLAKEVKAELEKTYGVNFYIEYSEQKRSTDTIAVDINNEPFRNSDGSIVFRPGGHGALIENLNDINADIVFIKNIDNVVPDRLKPQTKTYKKALAGLLIKYQSMVFEYLQLLENGKNLSLDFLHKVLTFTIEDLCIVPPTHLDRDNPDELLSYLIGRLNRPIRVCGMVKNEGEPGGGPFWAKNSDGTTSLQIVESSQIDLKDPQKKALFDAASHFNPVDLICGVVDYKGTKFNLLKYRDIQTGFISIKSKDGKELKAQELPGLWNGAMSDWITLFVEVPIVTFNPVKTVNDLLREQHQ